MSREGGAPAFTGPVRSIRFRESCCMEQMELMPEASE
jgi:hypothetical protein